jgi:hypothetical protein
MRTHTASRRSALGCAFALALFSAAPASADPPAGPPPLLTAAPPGAPVPVNTAPPPGAPVPINTAPPPASSFTANSAFPPGAPFAPAPQPGGAAAWHSGAPAWVAPPSYEDVDQFKLKRRLILVGSTILGIGYYGALMAGGIGVSKNNRGSKEWSAAFFPVAGPFIAAGLRAAPNDPQPADNAGTAAMIGIGVIQAVGAGLLLGGLRSANGRAPDPCSERTSSETRAPCRSPQVSVQPIVTPTFAGAGFTGSF